ncbi:cytochrome P450 [Micromonospora pisi]|uniref:Cytochrome P450 n=1 Tax=Micromonospora pisi TaxID=589240 RepID=A0A495JTQ2_9ACTN|nr:cytochrome P450 [Micromonospora pisi]
MVARPEDVTAALNSPALRVPPTAVSTGAAGALQARMARFSDGAAHTRRRALVEELLPNPDELRRAAEEQTGPLLDGRRAPFDVMPLARTVPVAVLATALGVAPIDRDRTVTLVGRLCDALAPTLAPPPTPDDPDAVADELTTLLTPVGAGDFERVAAVAGILFQARDATAALIGSALLAATPADGTAPTGIGRLVERTLREEPPVQCTRRHAADPVALGGVGVPPGATVWVLLAAAETGPPAPPATFGAGPHACPGATQARAVAGGFLSATLARGLRPVPGQRMGYEPRPNLRLPTRLLMERR